MTLVSGICTAEVHIPAPGSDVHRLAHRPGLDGLRGLAVAAVVAYHLGVPGAQGGFLGVDVFLVVSGYLITALLLTEHADRGRVDLGRFWARRARRLLPALVVVLVAVALWGHLAAPAATLDRLRGDGLAALAYVANWRFVLTGQSYVDGFLDPSPLRHLWSLGVEEQWYLVWPLIVVVLAGRIRRRPVLVGVLAAAAGASAVLMAALHHPGTDPSRAYYGTDTRAQALLVGAALAAWRVGRPVAWPRRRTADVGGAVGLALLGAAVVAGRVDADWLYRGGFLAVALATAGVVAVAADGRGPLADGLGARPLAWVGQRSYGIYLWHWPVVVALTEATTGWAGPALGAARVTVTLALATASYLFVEQPVRQGRWPVRPALGAGTVAVAASLALLVTLATPPSARPALAAALRPAPTTTVPVASAAPVPMARPAEPVPVAGPAAPVPVAGPAVAPVVAPTPAPSSTAATGPDPATPAATTAVAAPAPLQVLLLGDSQAVALGSSFTPGDAGPGIDVQGYAEVGCGLVPDAYECDHWRQGWAEAIERVRPDVVVLMVGAWEVLDHRIDGRWARFGQPGWTEAVQAAVTDAVATAAAGGVPLAVLDVACFAQAPGSPYRTEQRNQIARVVAVNRILTGTAAQQPRAHVLDYGGLVCPGGQADAEVAGQPLRYDGVHLSPAGARVTWEWLGPQLRALALAPIPPPPG